MPNLAGLLKDPVSGILDAAKGILATFIVDPEKKLEAQTELVKASYDFQARVMDAQQKFAESQAEVITTETKSDSWLAKNWRPITMLTFVFIIVWNYVVVPIFHASPTPIPDQMWTLLEIGIGGYIGARTVEKVATTKADGGK